MGVQAAQVGREVPVAGRVGAGAQQGGGRLGGEQQRAEPVLVRVRAGGGQGHQGRGAQQRDGGPVGAVGVARDEDAGDPDGERVAAGRRHVDDRTHPDVQGLGGGGGDGGLHLGGRGVDRVRGARQAAGAHARVVGEAALRGQRDVGGQPGRPGQPRVGHRGADGAGDAVRGLGAVHAQRAADRAEHLLVLPLQHVGAQRRGAPLGRQAEVGLGRRHPYGGALRAGLPERQLQSGVLVPVHRPRKGTGQTRGQPDQHRERDSGTGRGAQPGAHPRSGHARQSTAHVTHPPAHAVPVPDPPGVRRLSRRSSVGPRLRR